MKRQSVILLLLASASSLAACQEKQEQAVSLTQVQWEEVRSNLLTEPPKDLKEPMSATFGDKVELLGVSLDPAVPEAGKEVKITWYWRALADMDKDYQVFVHLDHKGAPPMRQGLDHHPVRELYQTSRWEKGQIIRDVQTVTLQPTFPGGPAELWAGLWHPPSNQRLPLKATPALTHDGDNRVLAYKLEVKGRPGAARPAPAAKQERPAYVVRPTLGPITIDGKLDEADWKRAAPTPRFGDTRGGPGKPGEAWAKVMYDQEFLYIAMHARDEDIWGTLEKRDADTWTQEVFEIFIDPDGDAKDYLELQFTPNNVVFDAKFAVKLGQGKGSRQEQIDAARAWDSKLTSAVQVEGTVNDFQDKDLGWTLELKLPLADVPGARPQPGTTWRANFYRFDLPRDAQGKPGRQIAWSWTPAHGFFHNVQHFGELRFVGQGAQWEPKRTLEPKPAALERGQPSPGGEVVAPDKPE